MIRCCLYRDLKYARIEKMNGGAAFALVVAIYLLLALGLRSVSPPLFPLETHRVTDTSFGVANKGVHSYHVFGAAAVDTLLTFVAAAVFAGISRAPVIGWLVLLLVTGEAMHWAYGIPTATYVWLFGTPERSR